jgi:eukaryotic-like serine/threonine-protein kinase
LSFWTELRRRKVVRATVAYLAAAFVVAQAAQLLVDALELPSNLLKIIVIVEIALLPLIIAAAWAFDWSPEGVHQTDSSAAPLRWRRIAPALLATVVLLGIGLAWVWRRPESRLDANLVAVLPFRVSGGNDIAYLREGMMDLLSAKLTGEGGPRAADPRSTMSALKASGADTSAITQDAAIDIAQTMGAAYVLLGSAVGSARQLTIHATLTDVRNGKEVRVERTGATDTLPAFIDHVAAELLSVRAGEGTRLASLTSTSLPALRAYLTAQSDYRNARFEPAIRNYQRALELDSTFALAAMGYILSTGWGAVPNATDPRPRRLLRSFASRLGEIDQLMANALVVPEGRTRTVRENIAAWEAFLAKAPDRSEGWFLYGDAMLHLGGLAGYPDTRTDGRRAFAKSLALDSAHTPALVHLLDDALLDHDRNTFLHFDSIRARRGIEIQSYERLPIYSIMGDSAGLARTRAAIDTLTQHDVYGMAVAPLLFALAPADGVRATNAVVDRAVLPAEKSAAFEFAHALMLGYGRPAGAAEIARRRMAVDPEQRAAVEAVVIMDAIYAHGDQALAREVVRRLESGTVAKGADGLAHSCALEQWHLWRGEPTRALEAARNLRAMQADDGQDRNSAQLCALVLEALHATFHNPGGARPALKALDDFLAPGPHVDERLISVANLATARMWERIGDREAAYRAVSRRAFHPSYVHYMSAMMAEQARMAALINKHDEAIRLYTWYLKIMEAAEPSMKPEIDRVRRELTRLTAQNN